MVSMASVVFCLDVFWQKVHLRPSTGLNFSSRNTSWSRTAVKLLGLVASLATICFLYWLFPEYDGPFYHSYFQMALSILPIWLLAAIPYFYWIDSKMQSPRDGYWHMGQLLLDYKRVNREIIKQHLLAWLIKGFFLGLMFTYLSRDLSKFVDFKLDSITNFKSFFDFSYDTLFMIDVALVSAGYVFSLKLFDTHIRSSEATVLGWMVALFCYEPFWSSTFSKFYLNYGSSYGWGTWLNDSPIAYTVWGSLILLLLIIYVWASVAFGCRFSNLTHRGIITSGPYRWMKHPAYLSKNLAWWMISVPFLAGGEDSVRKSILLLALNGIYYIRAKTEEKHLSQDPTYVMYAQWIRENGLFAKLGLSRQLSR